MLLLPGGDLLAAGNLRVGDAAHRIARFSVDAQQWSAVGGPLADPYDYPPRVDDMLLLANGTVAVAGNFTSAGGVPANNIAILDLATGLWSALPGLGSLGSISALALSPNGSLIAGGSYLQVLAESHSSSLVRYDFSLAAWSSIDRSGSIYELAGLPDGDLLVVGSFAKIAGWTLPAGNIARLDLATNTWTTLDNGVSGPVRAACIRPTGELYFGGNFHSAGGRPADGFARYDTIGLNPACPADINCSGAINPQDVHDFLTYYFESDARADVDHSSSISPQDLFQWLSVYFAGCP